MKHTYSTQPCAACGDLDGCCHLKLTGAMYGCGSFGVQAVESLKPLLKYGWTPPRAFVVSPLQAGRLLELNPKLFTVNNANHESPPSMRTLSLRLQSKRGSHQSAAED